MQSTQAELQGLDTVLVKAKVHHKCSDIHRIYLYRLDVVRELVGVVDTHWQDYTKLAHYMEGYVDPLVQILKEAYGRRVHALVSWAQVVNKGGTTNEINKEHKKVLDNIEMHGQLFRQQYKLASIDIEGRHK